MNNLFLLYGQDNRRIIRKRNEIISDYSIDEFNVSIFDMAETSINKAIDEAMSIPFLSDKRCVVMTNCVFFETKKRGKKDDESDDEDSEKTDSKKKMDFSYLYKYLLNPTDSTVLIIECPFQGIDKKNECIKYLLEKKKEYNIPLPDKVQITRDMETAFREANVFLTGDARMELLKRIQDDPIGYELEMDKLINYYRRGDKVTLKTVKALITETSDTAIFELSNALMANDKTKALNVFYNLIDQEMHPFQILSFLVKRFTQLLLVKELQNGGEATKENVVRLCSVSEGQAIYLMKDASKMTYEKLLQCLSDLKELDYVSKVSFKYGQDSMTPFELFFLRQ